MYKRFFLLCLLVLVNVSTLNSLSWSSVDLIDLRKIAKIESSNNPKAYNKRTQATGLFQITPICLKEFNQFHSKVNYSMEDLWNASISTSIANWYLNVRIPQMLRHFKKPVTVENILICYNAGIKFVITGIIPEETRNYLKKYKKG